MTVAEPGLGEIQQAITGLLREEEIATLATMDADPVSALWADNRVRLLWRVILDFDAQGGQVTAKRPYDAVVGRGGVPQRVLDQQRVQHIPDADGVSPQVDARGANGR
jgi:hypothetical protein